MLVKFKRFKRMKTNQVICSKLFRAQSNLKLIFVVNILFVVIVIVSFQIWLITIFDEYKYWLRPNLDKNDLAGFMNNVTNDGKVKYMAFECM